MSPQRRRHARLGAFAAVGAVAIQLSGCFLAHERAPYVEPVSCADAPPTCVTRASPCDPVRVVAATCDDASTTWLCPHGSTPLAGRVWEGETCLPLFGRLDPLFSDGVNESPVAVPIDGRCEWVFPSVGATLLLGAAVGSSCDALGDPAPIDTTGPGADYLAIEASVEVADGDVRVLSRGWTFDATAPFGVRAAGVGLGRVRGRSVRMDRWLFDDALDLGDAALVDGGFVYAYGCPGEPDWLEESCIVGRAALGAVDDPAGWDVYGARGWGAGEPVRVFGSGPHRGGVSRDPRGPGFMHVYAIGFGSTIEITTAPAPEGPWSSARTLARCDLPGDDPDAYCAGPVVHVELWDPAHPAELVVSYSVGTTAPDGHVRRGRDPAAYWPRVVRLAR